MTCNKFHFKSGVEMNKIWSDYDNISVSSLDEEKDVFPAECNNEFDGGFKKIDSSTKTSHYFFFWLD